MRAAIRVDDRTSQEDHQTTEMPSANGPSYAFMDIRIVLPVVLALLFLVLILALIHFYASCILQRRRLRLAAAGLLPIRSTPAPAKAGLKGSAIAAMPTFPYAEGQEAECLVCLNVVEKGEVMRLLPGCKHVFHADCIDMWLSLHSTCPLCRAVAETPAMEVMEAAAMAMESSSGAGPSDVVEIERCRTVGCFHPGADLHGDEGGL